MLAFVYLCAVILFLSFRIRYFAEKCTAAIFTDVQIEFFVITILFIAYLIAKNHIRGFARFSEFMWIPLLSFIIGVLFILFPEIKISNIYPVAFYDTGNILMGAVPILAVMVYFTCMLFLGEYVDGKKDLFKYCKRYIPVCGVIAISIVFCTIGVFGYKLSQVMSQPYFSALKNIELFTVIERVEALAITFWLVTDIVLIVVLFYIATTLIKRIFNLPSREKTLTPLLFLEYVLSLYIASSLFELEKYSRGIGSILYISFGIIIPFILYVIGKFRKVIS